MKRKERHHLKEDQFQKIVTQAVDFIRDHTKEISLVGAGLAIIILAFVVIQVINAQNLKKQNLVLDQIRTLSSEVDRQTGEFAGIGEPGWKRQVLSDCLSRAGQVLV